LALFLRAWDDKTAFGQALRESEQAGQYLISIFRYAPRKAVDGDTAAVVSRLLPHAITTGNVDVSTLGDELANAAQTALSQCLESSPPLSPSLTQGLVTLRNVLVAFLLLFVSEEAKSFIIASHSNLFAGIGRLVASDGFDTMAGSEDIRRLLPAFKPAE